MPELLTANDLAALITRVFVPKSDDHALGVMIDLPDDRVPDEPAWAARRAMAAEWVAQLHQRAAMLGYETRLLLYPNVHTNNGDLPAQGWVHAGGMVPQHARELHAAQARPMREILDAHPMILALTKFSSTAPLKVAARAGTFRAATMPGFGAAMIPALRIDYTEVNRRVWRLKHLLDAATGADIVFAHAGGEDRLHLDLRHRTGHASGGLLPDRGVAGNLPSGEAYIVPYEGEVAGDASRTAGILPVQFGDEIVRYEIAGNRAQRVLTDGPASERERARLAAEPAYGNIAELGLGVLAAFGVKAVGEVLLDEKLGLHIAFGRSEHFGGQVGPSAFSSPEAVVHIDRVYVKETQPGVEVASADLAMASGETVALMRAGEFGRVF